MTWLLGAALLFWLAMLVSLLSELPLLVEPPAARPPPDAPEVAVIVPARNEAHQIAACVESLLAQDWPRLRVVCVDDRSEDGTFAAASAPVDPRLVVVRGAELPKGWLGKNYANVQGVAHAGAADFLLFTDADTVHAPGALATAMASAQRHGADLYTVLSDALVESFWERAILPHVLAAVVSAFPLRLVNSPRSRMAIANGQYLLVRRAAYDAVGGHAAIKDRVADDLELARLFKARGFSLRVENGRSLVSVRMYRSLREIWWGFVKNASAGAGGVLPGFAGVLLIADSILPFFAAPFVRGIDLWLALAACALCLAGRVLLFSRVFPVKLRWALTAPLAGAVFAGIVLHSTLRQAFGKGPVWKGREYPHGR